MPGTHETNSAGFLSSFALAKMYSKVGIAIWLCVCSIAQAAESYGVDPESMHPTNVYWGDTHVHTSYSMDSNFFGNSRLSPVQAYQFAKGESVVTTTGQTARLDRPLDFLVVADHAESLGLVSYLRAKDPVVLAVDGMEELAEDIFASDGVQDFFKVIDKYGGPPSLYDMASREKIWRDCVAMAEEANDPGVFTALVGYEWGSTPNGDNLHRVVVYRDGAGIADQMVPFTGFDSEDPVELWKGLAKYHQTTGGEVLSIAHNGNLSNGLMFPETMANGQPVDKAYAELRQRWEPLVEVTQTKGDAEAHPLLSPDDEFADFSTWDKRNVMGWAAKEPWMLQYEYSRSALKLGLQIEDRTGVNPYDFGMIGSTDSHTTLATADDNNFWGTNGAMEPSDDRLGKVLIPSKLGKDTTLMSWQQDASGYAAVWAKSNTREDIYDAMARKEVYTSTGPRITLRFFGGWHFAEDAALAPDYVSKAYKNGVPMGGVLSAAPRKGKPGFVISALKDAYGANLDRVQVIKGWMDKDGKTHEKVYNVAWSDNRALSDDGSLPDVGNTVDLERASYRNSIGASALSTTWYDEDFNPAEPAFYYVRVLEIPTPRWVVYDAAFYDIDVPEKAQLTHQERAYSSPIWYAPK